MTNNQNASFKKISVNINKNVKGFLKNKIGKRLEAFYKKIADLFKRDKSAKNENGVCNYTEFLNEKFLGIKNKMEKEADVATLKENAIKLLDFFENNYKASIIGINTHRLVIHQMDLRNIYKYEYSNLKKFYMDGIEFLYYGKGAFHNMYPNIVNYFLKGDDGEFKIAISVLADHHMRLYKRNAGKYYIQNIYASKDNEEAFFNVIREELGNKAYDMYIELDDLKRSIDAFLKM